MISNEELIELAKKEANNARAELTNCKMGAAVVCKNGNIYLGANIESASSCSLSNCAERVALQSAIANGESEFEKIAVIGYINGEEIEVSAPCDVCRQYIVEFAKDIKIIFKYNHKFIERNIEQLVPYMYEFEEKKEE